MLTTWSGFGVPPDNCASTEIFLGRSLPLTLGDPPGVLTQVEVPATVHSIKLWSLSDIVWYAVDRPPGAVTPPVLDLVVPAALFRDGFVLMPGGWQECAVGAGEAHTLYLSSATSYATVYVMLLEEGF